MNIAKVIKVKVSYPKCQNFTPADAMMKFGRENGFFCHYNCFLGHYITINGSPYFYHSWKIIEDALTQTVILFLEKRSIY